MQKEELEKSTGELKLHVVVCDTQEELIENLVAIIILIRCTVLPPHYFMFLCMIHHCTNTRANVTPLALALLP